MHLFNKFKEIINKNKFLTKHKINVRKKFVNNFYFKFCVCIIFSSLVYLFIFRIDIIYMMTGFFLDRKDESISAVSESTPVVSEVIPIVSESSVVENSNKMSKMDYIGTGFLIGIVVVITFLPVINYYFPNGIDNLVKMGLEGIKNIQLSPEIIVPVAKEISVLPVFSSESCPEQLLEDLTLVDNKDKKSSFNINYDFESSEEEEEEESERQFIKNLYKKLDEEFGEEEYEYDHDEELEEYQKIIFLDLLNKLQRDNQ